LALKKFGLFELNIEVCGAVLVIVYLAYLLFRQNKIRNLSTNKSLQIELSVKKNKWNIYNYMVTVIGVYSIVSTELNTSIYSWTILNYLTVLIISLLVYCLYKCTSYEKRFLVVQNNELHFIE
jgi:L-asparagine transporter-like permease